MPTSPCTDDDPVGTRGGRRGPLNMLLSTLVETSNRVASTRSRREKSALLAALLQELHEQEIDIAVRYLSGELPQGKIGLGPALARSTATQIPAAQASLTLTDVDRAFARMAEQRGKGSQGERARTLVSLLAEATGVEQDFLLRLALGELRQGALEGVMTDAIAEATQLPAAELRRAIMLAGDPARVARAALSEGLAGLARFRVVPMTPVRPMLAQSAEDADSALSALGIAALEYKLDGARVQIHKVAREVAIFTRRLNEVTTALPEIVETVRELPVHRLILDGEAIAMDAGGRPLPFQTTMRRFGRRLDVGALRGLLPLSIYCFDCLYLEGEDLTDRSTEERWARLSDALPSRLLVPRRITRDGSEAGAFLQQALARGHEGIMAKALDVPYEAGNRGAGWLKIKPAKTLDLVVLAAEWGSGRRRGRLSNLHLGARDQRTGGFVMLGKTFKGLTDRLLAWQTRELLARELGRDGHIVHVRPELVVEIAFNELQASPQYPAGLALRFARVKGYRSDKTAAQADNIDTVRELYAQQRGPA
jgi:DNA ligase-1